MRGPPWITRYEVYGNWWTANRSHAPRILIGSRCFQNPSHSHTLWVNETMNKFNKQTFLNVAVCFQHIFHIHVSIPSINNILDLVQKRCWLPAIIYKTYWLPECLCIGHSSSATFSGHQQTSYTNLTPNMPLYCWSRKTLVTIHWIRLHIRVNGISAMPFYHAMHYSAYRGLAIAYRLYVRPSVCLWRWRIRTT